MIAAIAEVHHLRLVTSNLADFSGFEVLLPNPLIPGAAP